MSEKCCGACKHMKNEDIYGIGVCEINNEAVYCGDGKHCLGFLKNCGDMKAAELMIGDLVKTNKGDIIKVESISTKRQHRKVGYHPEEDCTKIKYVRQGQIEPILLTPEILEANGFKYDETLHRTHNGKSLYSGECIELRDCLNEYGYPIPNTYRIEVMGYEIKLLYVHQLQRALRVCGFNEEADNFKLN